MWMQEAPRIAARTRQLPPNISHSLTRTKRDSSRPHPEQRDPDCDRAQSIELSPAAAERPTRGRPPAYSCRIRCANLPRLFRCGSSPVQSSPPTRGDFLFCEELFLNGSHLSRAARHTNEEAHAGGSGRTRRGESCQRAEMELGGPAPLAVVRLVGCAG